MRALDPHFFDAVSPIRVALTHGTIDLPIVYRDVEALTAFFPFPARNAAKLLPAGSGLTPVLAWPVEVVTRAMALFGDAGITTELGLEKRLRDARLLQIFEGTNQVNRVLVAEERLPA